MSTRSRRMIGAGFATGLASIGLIVGVTLVAPRPQPIILESRGGPIDVTLDKTTPIDERRGVHDRPCEGLECVDGVQRPSTLRNVPLDQLARPGTDHAVLGADKASQN